MSTKNHPIAIVLGGDVNALGQVRALGQEGISVGVICADRSQPAAHSRYATAAFVAPDDDYDSHLEHAILTLAQDSPGRAPLLASSDAFVGFIARNRERLEKDCAFNVVDDKTLLQVTDKARSHDLAKSCGLNVPSTVPLQSFVDDASLITRFSYPALLKPRDSYSIRFPWKNCLVRSHAELESVLVEWPYLVPYALVQQIIPGPEAAIFQCNVYIGRNVPTQACTVQKIRQQPMDFGTMSFGRTLWMPSLVEDTIRLLESVAYTGFASVEYKQSSSDDRCYLIEINPRLPWYNILFTACGINFPLLAYQDLISFRPITTQSKRQQDGVHWLHFRNELRGAWERMRSGRWSEAVRGLAGIWRSRAFGLFSIVDPRPFVVGYANYVRDFFRGRPRLTRPLK